MLIPSTSLRLRLPSGVAALTLTEISSHCMQRPYKNVNDDWWRQRNGSGAHRVAPKSICREACRALPEGQTVEQSNDVTALSSPECGWHGYREHTQPVRPRGFNGYNGWFCSTDSGFVAVLFYFYPTTLKLCCLCYNNGSSTI